MATLKGWIKQDHTFGRMPSSSGCGHTAFFCAWCKKTYCEKMLKLHRRTCDSEPTPPKGRR